MQIFIIILPYLLVLPMFFHLNVHNVWGKADPQDATLISLTNSIINAKNLLLQH